MISILSLFRVRLAIYASLILLGILAIFLVRISKTSPKFVSPEKTIEKYRSLAEKSPSDALQILREDSAHVPEINAMCHRISHEIGRISMRSAKNFKEATSIQDSFCNSGYLHGVIEEFLSHQTITVETLEKVCPANTTFSYNDWECWHGIGHGIMYSYDNNLQNSLDTCQSITLNEAKAACLNGVFMELFSSENVEKNPEMKVLSLCSQQLSNLKNDCYLYAASAYMSLHKNMYEDAFSWCRTAEKQYIIACIQGVGSELIRSHLDDVKFVDRTCRASQDYGSCIAGAASYAYFHFGSSRPVGYICVQLSDDGSKICASIRKQLAQKFPENEPNKK